MKITSVETLFVRIPMAFSYAGGASAARGAPRIQYSGSVIVKLHTDEGMVGIGDVIVKGGSPVAGKSAKLYVDEHLAPVVVGQDPFNLEALLNRLWGANLHQSSIFVAGVDIALHDLVCKALGIPLYKYLGGKARERVPLTWNVPSNPDTSTMVQQAAAAVENGFTNVVKVKCGAPWDVEALAAIQKVIGDVPVRPDDNGAFLAGESIVRYRRARDLGVRFELLEQPAPNTDLQGLRRVRDALGERVMYHIGYVEPVVAVELLRQNVADVVSVPVFRHGVRQATQMVRAFELANIGCAMGSGLESTIAATAAIHVATALQNMRYPVDTLGPLWFSEDIVKERPDFAAGFARAPEGPGLGIELDDAQVDKLRMA